MHKIWNRNKGKEQMNWNAFKYMLHENIIARSSPVLEYVGNKSKIKIGWTLNNILWSEISLAVHFFCLLNDLACPFRRIFCIKGGRATMFWCKGIKQVSISLPILQKFKIMSQAEQKNVAIQKQYPMHLTSCWVIRTPIFHPRRYYCLEYWCLITKYKTTFIGFLFIC